ncbi:TRCF domain-containing protein, partial [Listeria rocourtiae]
DSVGFDLYSQMLQEAIAARQPKEEHEKIVPVEIDITVDAYIPEHYIQDGRQKIEMYKRFRTVLDMDDLEELRSDMMDRFGDYPEQVEYLFMITELKVYAMRVGIESIKQDAEKITIQFSEDGTQNMRGDMVMQVIGEYGRQIGVGMDGQQLRITVNVSKKPLQEWLFDLKTLTDKLSEAKKEVSESSAE